MQQQPQKKPGVLLVDDDPLVLTTLHLALERKGFHVLSATSGHEAIAFYRDHRDDIDVLLLDVNMPVLDGPKTLDAIRAMNPNVVCLFMSGDTGSYQPQELLAHGAAQILAKPFPLDELVDTLHEAVRRAPPSGE